MKTLETRLHTTPKKALDGYVQVHVDGRWCSNREFYVGKCSYKCDASGIESFEFVQLENHADCDLVEAAGAYWVHIAIGDVFRRCKVCGDYDQTFYGYRIKNSNIPLATGNHRWAAAQA